MATPASVALTVTAGTTATLAVSLDLPAPAGGATVTLTSAIAGAVPPSVTVAADQLSASFVYTQTGPPLPDTVTATLGAVTKSAAVTVIQPHLVINEIDYDNVGSDTDEFIELYNPAAVPADLSTLAVVLVNGANNQEYDRYPLSGTLPAHGFLVLASSTVMVDPAAMRITFKAATNNVQNGNPDGVLLLDTAAGKIVDALSYGGAITAAMVGGLAAPVSLVEGSAATATDSNSVRGSLVRLPDGHDSDDAAADWSFTSTPTAGAANVKTP
jgi:hypothetical protein